ncbi:mannitol dehydrogenase family protein [Agrobacterium rhizogenes]|nr:mannitol dehydrogenase family protein [Rhizobium rhizogenes]NTJ79409.1 mannitol dehydrogenase family protein [Rhizobium rhizogenes]
MSERLSSATLSKLPANVALPKYDRTTVTPGIVHLGVGAFHRAHQAVFTHDCLNAGETEWGIIAASLRSGDTQQALQPQDNLYCLSLRDGEGEQLRIIGALVKTIVAPEDPAALLHALTDPAIRIVTLTVTEKGYTANLAERTLLRDHADVVHDLANPARPRSVLGFLAEAISRRRDVGVAPFTLLSCDNLPSNGRTLLRVLTEFASLRSPDLGAFIASNVSSPSSMVDRIVPATTDEDRARIAAELGVEDAWPVMAEPFFQWVIEDRFATGRPQWQHSGVEFVEDVVPFEHMKLRMLNGSHTAIAAIGQIAGLETVSKAFGHPTVRNFIQRYWAQVSPTLDPAVDGKSYSDRLTSRFDNPSLRHRTLQIASDASQKVPQRILEPLRELIAAHRPHEALVYAVAAWIRSCADTNETGQPLTVNDAAFQTWSAKPDQTRTEVAAVIRQFLEFYTVFDPSWKENEHFIRALTAALQNIREHGIIAALDAKFGPMAA